MGRDGGVGNGGCGVDAVRGIGDFDGVVGSGDAGVRVYGDVSCGDGCGNDESISIFMLSLRSKLPVFLRTLSPDN